MKRYIILFAVMALTVGILAAPASAGSGNQQLKINVLLNTSIDDGILAELGDHGRVTDELYEIDAVFMKARAKDLDAIRDLPFVAAANPDAERKGAPIDTVQVEDFSVGLNTWNLDAINVTGFGFRNREVGFDGDGVYVAVLDTGLLDSWRQYFPQERIATEFAKSFGGGGGERGNVSEQPNKWEHDQDSHGTHVTSTILGYSLRGDLVNGVAPMAKVIPVKVLNQNGSGWSSTVAAGITYVGDLKRPDGRLYGEPVVINMSLGGPALDAVEKAAIDYAIAQGVIIVASAGNEGTAGMGYPGAYPPVISVAAAGWTGEWLPPQAVDKQPGWFQRNSSWWYNQDVLEKENTDDYYITDFSSRSLKQCDDIENATCQDLDVAAPGSWVVGPYQVNSGQLSYYFLGGTSMASPHVAGIVALMLDKNPSITADDAEGYLETAAMPMDQGCRLVGQPYGPQMTSDLDDWREEICWGDNAGGEGFITADEALHETPMPVTP